MEQDCGRNGEGALTFSFRPAARERTQLLIGLGGPSGSGKTRSALRLATGLAGDEPILFIDTENGRALHYARRYKFHHGGLSAPFTPERYEEALEAALALKPGVVIIDSASHEHEGPGGILEQHETELTRMAGQDWKKREQCNFSAWIRPKASHNRFVNRLLQMRVHLILAFRAKDKMILVKNERGKQEPVSIGWTPITADRMDYECTMMLVLPPGSQGRPDLTARSTKLSDEHASIVRNGEQITEDMGAALRKWADGGDLTPVASPDPISFAQSDGEPEEQAPEAYEDHPKPGILAERVLAAEKTAMKVETAEQFGALEKKCRPLLADLDVAGETSLHQSLISILNGTRTRVGVQREATPA
jgi:hypothetical protein